MSNINDLTKRVEKLETGIIIGDRVMTIDQVAAWLKLHRDTVHRMVANGTLPMRKIGGTWRIRRSALEAWFENQKTYANE